MTFVTKRNTHITLCVIGGCYVLGYGFLGIDFGHGSIPSHEAWDRGVAQPYVLAGFILVALSTIYYRGGTWARWPILLWYPLTVTSGAFWADWLDVAKFDALQFVVMGCGTSVIAVLLTWRVFFRLSMPRQSHLRFEGQG